MNYTLEIESKQAVEILAYIKKETDDILDKLIENEKTDFDLESKLCVLQSIDRKITNALNESILA